MEHFETIFPGNWELFPSRSIPIGIIRSPPTIKPPFQKWASKTTYPCHIPEGKDFDYLLSCRLSLNVSPLYSGAERVSQPTNNSNIHLNPVVKGFVSANGFAFCPFCGCSIFLFCIHRKRALALGPPTRDEGRRWDINGGNRKSSGTILLLLLRVIIIIVIFSIILPFVLRVSCTS